MDPCCLTSSPAPPGLGHPPLSPRLSTSSPSDWFVITRITHADTGATIEAVGSDSDSDSESRSDSDSDSEWDIVYFAAPSADTHSLAQPLTPLPIMSPAPLQPTHADPRVTIAAVNSDSGSDSGSNSDTESEWDIVYLAAPRADTRSLVLTPLPIMPPVPQQPTHPPRPVIHINPRHVSAPGFHAAAEFAVGARWVGADTTIRLAKRSRYNRAACPIVDVIFVPPSAPRPTSHVNVKSRSPVPARSRMAVRVVNAREELAKRFAAEAMFHQYAAELCSIET